MPEIKKFACSWSVSMYDEPLNSIETMDFFTEETGYDADDISSIEKLELDEIWNETPGHVVVRVQ